MITNPTEFNLFTIKAFSYLVDSKGFKIEYVSDYYISYMSPRVKFSIAYDKQKSFEVFILISLLTKEEKVQECAPLTQSDIFNLYNITELPKFFQSEDEGAVIRYIQKVAAILKSVANELFEGDAFLFKKMQDYRAKISSNYAQTKKLQYVIEDANKCWNKHDYNGFISVTSNWLKDLPLSYTKKYKIAEAKIKGDEQA